MKRIKLKVLKRSSIILHHIGLNADLNNMRFSFVDAKASREYNPNLLFLLNGCCLLIVKYEYRHIALYHLKGKILINYKNIEKKLYRAISSYNTIWH